jgi:translation initiation factor 1
MTRENRRKRRGPESAAPVAEEPLLARLLKEKGFSTAETEAAAAELPPAGQPLDFSRAGKIVLARERKGRGGRTVTRISGAGLPTDLEALARDLRQALGCGASVEGATVIVQGDIPERVRTWLEAHGARQIVAGS